MEQAIPKQDPEIYVLTHQRDEFRQALADCQLALSAANATNAYKDRMIEGLRLQLKAKETPPDTLNT
ncbi:hypothetical protein ACIPY3_02675 [Paenarthrobacter sp. NPDC089714]|uniref:hypothetical protein n=1 Tax=Paenarthrobacter sp. NPDC089714 TaxID=3364377 RepID=UPI00380F67E8